MSEFRCKYSIMLWQYDEEGDGEGGHARRHLGSLGDKMIIKWEDEGTTDYKKNMKDQDHMEYSLSSSDKEEEE